MSLPPNLFEHLGLHSTRPKIAKFPPSTSQFWCKRSWHNTDLFEVCDWSKHVCLVFIQISNQMPPVLHTPQAPITLLQLCSRYFVLDKFYLLYIIWTFLHKWNSVSMVETEKVHSLKLTKHHFKFLKFRKSLHTATWLRETEIAVRISCWLERVTPCIVDVCISLITRLAHQIIVLTYNKFKKLTFVVHQKVCSTNFCHYDRDKNRMYSVSPWFWFLNKLLQHYPHLT